MASLLLVRYGELALKSAPVRREFERTLQRNILDQFLAAGDACRIRSDRGHLYVEADDLERASRTLCRVFGVTSVSVVHEVASDPAAIWVALKPLTVPLLRPGSSFAIRARRVGDHPFSSQELARDLGAQVLAAWPALGLKVDLDHPELEISVEVRGPRTYLSFDRRRGPGGLPLGVAGRVAALVDGPRGALGAWLMMKRGCQCAVVATDSADPRLREVLHRFDPKSPVGEGVAAGEAPRRLLEIAEASHADGIVLPLSVEAYPAARALWTDRVVFSPTVGLTDEEVGSRWEGVVRLSEGERA
ncbi:MAG TPA: THUMP domain-containing protein [Thermoplasmata archaeon]|nr:THUMP domain-containing protein [Thermoplasmata archaeon]